MRKIKPKISERQTLFCELYSKYAGNVGKVCIDMGISMSQASKYLEQPIVKERLGRAVQIARERIEAATPHLVNLALEMVNDENTNPKIRAQLLDSLLDRGGVSQPKQPLLQINLNTEVQDRARQILAERVEQGRSQQTLTIDIQNKNEEKK